MTSTQVFVLGKPDNTLYSNSLWFKTEDEASTYIKALEMFGFDYNLSIIPVTISIPTKFLIFFE